MDLKVGWVRRLMYSSRQEGFTVKVCSACLSVRSFRANKCSSTSRISMGEVEKQRLSLGMRRSANHPREVNGAGDRTTTDDLIVLDCNVPRIVQCDQMQLISSQNHQYGMCKPYN